MCQAQGRDVVTPTMRRARRNMASAVVSGGKAAKVPCTFPARGLLCGGMNAASVLPASVSSVITAKVGPGGKAIFNAAFCIGRKVRPNSAPGLGAGRSAPPCAARSARFGAPPTDARSSAGLRSLPESNPRSSRSSPPMLPARPDTSFGARCRAGAASSCALGHRSRQGCAKAKAFTRASVQNRALQDWVIEPRLGHFPMLGVLNDWIAKDIRDSQDRAARSAGIRVADDRQAAPRPRPPRRALGGEGVRLRRVQRRFFRGGASSVPETCGEIGHAIRVT